MAYPDSHGERRDSVIVMISAVEKICARAEKECATTPWQNNASVWLDEDCGHVI